MKKFVIVPRCLDTGLPGSWPRYGLAIASGLPRLSPTFAKAPLLKQNATLLSGQHYLYLSITLFGSVTLAQQYYSHSDLTKRSIPYLKWEESERGVANTLIKHFVILSAMMMENESAIW